MRVDATGNGNNLELIERLQKPEKNRGFLPAVSTGYREATGPAVASSAASAPEVLPAPGDSPAESAPATPDESPRGVIRLLQEGHFRGVADVRLRINFAEELQGIQAAGTGALLNEALPALQRELDAAIEAFVGEGSLPEEAVSTLREAQTAFNTQLGTLLEGGEDGVGPADDVFAALRTAFEDFLASLVPPQAPEEDAILPIAGDAAEVPAGTPESALAVTEPTTVPVAEGETDLPGDAFAGLRETLRGIFEETLASAQDSIDALALPPLSEPNGNGRAYEKFLAAYDDLFGVGSDSASSAPPASLDTIS